MVFPPTGKRQVLQRTPSIGLVSADIGCFSVTPAAGQR
jgi:hypothetical protein